jgi:hypothetical protein
MKATTLVGGLVLWHWSDRKVAFEKAAGIEGDCAIDFMGIPRYRNVTLHVDDEISKAAA